MATSRLADPLPSEADDLEQLWNVCLGWDEGRDEGWDECLSVDTYYGGCYFNESLPHPGLVIIDESLIRSQGWGTDENFTHEIGLGNHLTGQNSTETCGKGFKVNFLEKKQKLNEKNLETLETLKTLKTLETLSLLRTLQILDPANRDAYFAMEAMEATTSTSISCLQVVVELACTRSSRQLLSWKQAYHAQYKKSPEEDIAHRTSGDFRELLVPLVSSYRYDGDEVNLTLAKEEAKILREKILDKAYGDDDLIRILATRSKAQVNATLNQYRNEFGNDINKDLKTDPKDQFLFILRATVKCLTRPEKYFEKVLRLAINRRGTDEAALIRVVVTRAEVDMKLINEEYQRRNNVPLHRAIVKDTHGEYEKMLLALVGHADP